MPNVENAKKNKIKPENVVHATGTVVKCRYAGESSFGIGPMRTQTHFYKVFLQVEGQPKPLCVKVKEKEGWNASIVADFKGANRMFGGNKPVNEGDVLPIVYDRLKPKKCYMPDGQ